ncbi:hypothetical protein PV328_006782 [Microctonus aethiopoides]|uniref:Peptidase M12B domain-containing protein n=1 Tax=Microctonus aethiopoides TaxID=144406 RepID=A0AA39FPV2_9HYME|nr:hypothetical protein PV328_006782 [Microctonus aethiopoides]
MEEHIGEFTTYHDEEKSAAIVYFKKTGTLHGIIDTRYIISWMPLNECNQGHQAGEAYVKRREGYMDIHEPLKLWYPLILPNEKTKTHESEPYTSTQYQAAEKIQKVVDKSDKTQVTHYEPPKKRQKVDDKDDKTPVTSFYPEILVFVPNEVTTYMSNGKLRENSFATTVGHYIIYFNAIDMLLGKLSTDDIKIHLNLAGIVFERRSDVFPFIKVIKSTPPNIDTEFVFRTIPDYINANKDIFPDNSFDFFFVSTGKRQDPPNERYELGSLVHQGTPCEYITAAHEIAHLLGVKHDPQGVGYTNGYDQCYAIMQQFAGYCADCLKWSDRSIQDLKKYARENRNRCFLLNSPRSLLPRGHPIKTLLPSEQCRCYGFEHCNEKLICSDGSNSVSTVLPLDGTPCGDNKVCWDRICKDLSPVPSSLLEEGNVI